MGLPVLRGFFAGGASAPTWVVTSSDSGGWIRNRHSFSGLSVFSDMSTAIQTD